MNFLRGRHFICVVPLALVIFLFSFGDNIVRAETRGAGECGECHTDYLDDWAPTKHGKIFLNNPRNVLEARVCEACHGYGTNHIVNVKKVLEGTEGEIDLSLIRVLTKKSKLSASEKNEVCLQCHKKDLRIFGWRGSQHDFSGLACLDCHQYRKTDKMVKLKKRRVRSLPREMDMSTELCVGCHVQRRAQLQRTSHMPLREGKMSCADCHNPHGGKGPSQLKEATVNETCYTCHQEKRGPFLWEHAPVRENCSNCHDPHGSNYRALLKIKDPYLCKTCHSYTYHPSDLFDRDNITTAASAEKIAGKGCLNCHSMVHGSNHPSGARLTR